MTTTMMFIFLPIACAAVGPSRWAIIQTSVPTRLVSLGLLVLAMTLLGWIDPFHLFIATIVVVIVELLALLSPQRASTRHVDRRKLERDRTDFVDFPSDQAKPVQGTPVRSAALGILMFAAVALVSWLASFVPGLEALAFDRDRAETELKIDALQEAGDSAAAADLITARLQRRTSREWHRILVDQLYECLIAAGTAASGDQAEVFFRQAIELAEQNQLDDQLASTHIDRLNLRGSVDRQAKTVLDLARADQERQAEIHQLTSQMADACRQRDELESQLAASRQETEGLQRNLTQTQADLTKNQEDRAEALLSLLVDWGDSMEPSNPLKCAKYREAETIAKQHGLPTTLVDARLTDLDKAIARLQPASLPSGVQAVVQHIDASAAAPLTIVDLALRLPTGNPVTDLAVKDFRLHLVDGTVVDPLVVDQQIAVADAMQIVFLFDHSNSTGGLHLAAAKAGGAGMLNHLQGMAQVRIISFATDLSVIADWTSDLPASIPNLEKLSIAGNTALLQAIAQAAADLAGRSGPKAIILFTDGRDNVGGPSIAELTARCQQAGIVVHAIALETAELDRDSLAQVTLATGGLLLPASNADELPKRFRQAAEALQQSYYRLVFPASLSTGWEIIIGGENAVRVSNRTSEANAKPTPQNRR
ncbi:MAG: VWA domain-containing protein [Planctomycetes bacterium]|nr:VWA domain-containing protein [Planctomycetota bacterium]